MGRSLHGKVKIDDWVGERTGRCRLSLPCLWCKPINIFPLERAGAAVVAVKVSLWNPVVNHDLISTVVSTNLEKSFPDFGM